MSHDQHHLEPAERLLLEHRNADVAGVFRPTQVDARALLHSPAPARTSLRNLRWVATSLAACLALAVSARVWIATTGTHPVESGASAQPGDKSGSNAKNPFVNCLTGPLASVGGTPCDRNDVDGDGDIDLADFSLSQARIQERS